MKIDPECIRLCRAINHIRGIKTTESCCGHGKTEFMIWFKVIDIAQLPKLLYFLDPCHVGFRWWCKVTTDCGMSPVHFRIESIAIGEKAYEQADIIAESINEYLLEEKLNSRNMLS